MKQSARLSGKFGTGKKGTQWVFANRSTDTNFFASDPASSANGNLSVWDFCKHANDTNVNGCNDWFVPSYKEISVLSQSYNNENTWNRLIYGGNASNPEECFVYSSTINIGWSCFWGTYGVADAWKKGINSSDPLYAVVLIRSI